MEDDYEVPSPHEHAVEKEKDSLAQKIALMTAVLATVGALYRHPRRVVPTHSFSVALLRTSFFVYNFVLTPSRCIIAA